MLADLQACSPSENTVLIIFFAIAVPQFLARKFLLTVNGGDGSGSGEYARDDAVTVKADTPEFGYQFAGWKITAGTASIPDLSQSEFTFQMGEEDLELTAAWSAIEGEWYRITSTFEDGIALHPTPDKESEVIARLKYDTIFYVIDQQDNYGYTKYDGQEGWINLDYAELADE